MIRTLACLFLFCLPFSAMAQHRIAGIVLDESDEGLAFANIIVNGDEMLGVTADVDGVFEVEISVPINTLNFSYVGYEELDYTVTDADRQKGSVTVGLKPSSFGLGEVVVLAGENPAHRIIRRAVQNKKRSNHENVKTYECEIYSKMDVRSILVDTAAYEALRAKAENANKKKDRILPGGGPNDFDRPLFISEVVTERRYKRPGLVRNKLMHTRISGLKKMDLSGLNNFNQFSFYDDFVYFSDQAYVNPISKGSTQLYFFNIADTLYQGADTVFVLTYKPKKGKVFESLQGVLYINTNGYAIQNVWAEPTDTRALTFKLEHKYGYLEEEARWFPEQFNFEMTLLDPKAAYAKFRMVKRSYISKVRINPEFSSKDLRDDFIALEGEVISRDEAVWAEHRTVPLTEEDKRVYLLMDSVGEARKLDLLLSLPLSFITGKLALGEVDWVWDKFLGFNNHETVRLGAGFQTNRDFSRRIAFGGYLGYGFKDKEFKYGGNVIYDLLLDELLEVKYAYQKDIHEPGLLSFSLQEDVVLSGNIYADLMDREESHQLALQSQHRFLKASVGLKHSTITPLYPYAYKNSADSTATYRFTEASVNLRYAFGENYNWFMGTRLPSRTTYPILYLAYIKGLETLGGGFSYHKINLTVEHRFNTRFLGETEYKLEAGMVRGDAPYGKLYVSGGAVEGRFSFQNLDDGFQTMNSYEFVSDRFVNLFLEHDFGGILYRNKYSQPSLVLIHNMGFGVISSAGDHGRVDAVAPTKGFFESGIGINNLFTQPIFQSFRLGFGLKLFYRYGPYKNDKRADNWALRANMRWLL